MKIATNSYLLGLKNAGVEQLSRQRTCVLLIILLTFILTAVELFAKQKTLGDSVSFSLNANTKVVVAAEASKTTQTAASELAAILSKMTGHKIKVVSGKGTSGIAVGTIAEFPDLIAKNLFDTNDPFRQDEYVLGSHQDGLYAIACKENGVYFAVYDFLHRLGYRQYFPGKVWEIIPQEDSYKIAVNVLESPDFVTRDIHLQWGTLRNNYNDWRKKNRLPSAFYLRNGHVWNAFYAFKKSQGFWKKHPEYLGLVRGKRTSMQFCVSNAGLRNEFSDWIVDRLKSHPQWQTCSVEPADGGGWCECAECKKLGVISNRVVLLANETARKVVKAFPKKKIYLGMLAYYQHSDPPTIRVHPRIIVNATDGMRTSKLPLKEAIEGWRKMGVHNLGKYDYFSVHQWYRDLPGFIRASNTSYLRKTLKQNYSQEVRFFSAESGDNFGPCGFGYYFASRILWNIKSADHKKEIMTDFTQRCFGPAANTMKDFYNLYIDASDRRFRRSDIIGQMYLVLKKALREAKTITQKERIKQLILYTVYAEYYNRYQYEKEDLTKRQKYFEAMMKHVYRIRKTGMVHTWAFQTIASRDKKITFPPEAQLWTKKGRKNNPWVSDKPFSDKEITGLLEAGLRHNKTFKFTRKIFSANLVPTDKMNIPKVTPGSLLEYHQNIFCKYYFWVKPGEQTIRVNMGGTERSANLWTNINGKPAMISKYKINKELPNASLLLNKKYEMTLSTPTSGLYWIVLSGPRISGTVSGVQFPDKRPFVISAGYHFSQKMYSYFYVPKGTKLVAGKAGDRGSIFSPDRKKQKNKIWQERFTQTWQDSVNAAKAGRDSMFIIPVKKGEDGKLWKLTGNSPGPNWLPMTVPPYFTKSRKELLLPKEVVDAELRLLK